MSIEEKPEVKYKKAEFQAKLAVDDQEEFEQILRSCGLNNQTKFTELNLALARDFAKKLYEVKEQKQLPKSESVISRDDLLHCSKCDTDKPKSEFYPNKKLARGYESYCKACKKEYQKQNQEKKKLADKGVKSTTNNNIMPSPGPQTTTPATETETFTITKEDLIEFGKAAFAKGVEKGKQESKLDKAPIYDILDEICNE